MSSASGHWDDLLPRILSALALAALGLLVVWQGGLLFSAFTALVAAIMIWELSRMFDAGAAGLWLAIGSWVALVASATLSSVFAPALLLLPAGAALFLGRRSPVVFAVALLGLLVASYGVLLLRETDGFVWMIWFALVVIASDVSGYFAGRLIGGPKIWPRLSPKKTWSGTIAGWVTAALVSVPFALMGFAGLEVVAIGAVGAFAGQLGDLTESAIKRAAGVKDASGLMPGHGGLLDRFDSMAGASIFLLLFGLLADFPPTPGI